MMSTFSILLSEKALNNHVEFLGAAIRNDVSYILLQIGLITSVSSFQMFVTYGF